MPSSPYMLYGILVLAGILNYSVATTDDTLQLLQVVIRHGNRTAIDTFPQYESWVLKTYSPFEFGQLTAPGRRQMSNVGNYVRQRYSDFLPEQFSYTDVSVKCAAMNRVQESSAIAMASMFPPKDKQQWQDSGLGDLWTPIACESLPPDQDTLFEPDATHCPEYTNQAQEYFNSTDFLTRYNELTENGALNNYLQYCLNMSAPITFGDLYTLWDNLNSMKDYKLALPSWTTHIYPEPLTQIVALVFGQFYATPALIRFAAGEILKENLRMASLLQDGLIPQSKKMYAYFGHDNNIMPILVALGFETPPPAITYGAAIIMELHRNKTTSEIGYKFLYRNETWSDPILHTMPGCQEICSLSYVKKYLEPYIPTKAFHDYCYT